MTFAEALHRITACPEAVPDRETADALRDAAARWPFSALAPALLLRYGLVEPGEADAMRARVAVLTADKQALASLAAAPGEDPATFYPPQPVAEPVSTDSAIDTFLDTYGRTSPEEDALLERLIFNPVPEYADLLEDSEAQSAPSTAQDAMIDAFLRREEEAQTPFEMPAPEEPGGAEPAPQPEAATAPESAATPADNSLSESLARIFIGRGSYGRALEIISDLAARFPEKNPFYADQIRYLQKLVTLQGMAGGGN